MIKGKNKKTIYSITIYVFRWISKNEEREFEYYSFGHKKLRKEHQLRQVEGFDAKALSTKYQKK